MNPAWPERIYPLYDLLSRARRALFGAGTPFERGEGLAPFFIVGSGRSGNTLLRRMISANPDVFIPPETYELGPAIRLFARKRERPWPELVRRVLALFEFHPEFDRFGVSLRPLAESLDDMPQEERSLARLIDALFRHLGAGRSFRRWGDKSPFNVYSLPWILRTFPDARFVHMLRDGADAALSYVEAGLKPDLRAAAIRWRESVRAVRRFSKRQPDACIEVRYENLVADPAAELRRACGHLGIDFDPAMVERLDHAGDLGDLETPHLSRAAEPVTDSRAGRARRELSPEDLRLLDREIGAELRAWGYPPLPR